MSYFVKMNQIFSLFYMLAGSYPTMSGSNATGGAKIQNLAGRDLNKDGKVVNLVISGNSRFYDYEWLEEQLDEWIKWHDHPDLIICGGASGVDYLAERWADNNAIEIAVFTEEWNEPRTGVEDTGRPEAPPTLVEKMLEHATHVLGFPGKETKWTRIVLDKANERGIPIFEIPTP